MKLRGDTADRPVEVSHEGSSLTFDTREQAVQTALMVLRAVNGGSILLDAYEVGDERGRDYGDPSPNMEAIGDLVGGYLGTGVDGFDAAVAMTQVKAARLKTGGRKRDTLVDIAGYARVAAEVEGVNDNRDGGADGGN